MTTKKSAKKTAEKSDTIEVQCLVRVGLGDRTSEKGEVVLMPREWARKLQESGAIKVVI